MTEIPWHIESDHEECSGFAVVKDSDGSMEACHETEEDAKKHMAALYANEPSSRSIERAAQNNGIRWVLDELALVRNMRTSKFDDLDVKIVNNTVEFVGHAAVYDEETQFDIPGIGTVHEVVDRGAFRKILARKPEVPMLYNHNPEAILADTANGTLTLKEDVRGLLVNATLDKNDPDVHRVVTKIASGLVRGMSFGFVAGRENQTIEHRAGGVLRRLSGFKKLLDVGPVVGPAYSGTDVALRSALLQFADSSESLQQILMGAYPQLEDGEDSEGTEEEARAARADGTQQQRFEAARRRLAFIQLQGGYDDAS